MTIFLLQPIFGRKEDYLMGINFFPCTDTAFMENSVSKFILKYENIRPFSVGRGYDLCTLEMVVRREARDPVHFVKTPVFTAYSVALPLREKTLRESGELWKAADISRLLICIKRTDLKRKPMLKTDTGAVCESAAAMYSREIERKKENRNPPLLFNLAELQNVCSKLFKISPDETLKIVQELYEKKLVTYPRTDARVLSTAAAKEIYKNISGLRNYEHTAEIAQHIIEQGNYKNLAKTRYVNDKQITDHYAIVPTGQGLNALRSVSLTAQRVYETIVRRFVCIFYPPAVYQKDQSCDKNSE